MTEPFKFSDGQLAYTVEELISICQKSPSESLEYLMREDFEKWLDYIGKSDLAAKARQVRQASLSDGDRIKQFITQCQSISVPTQKSSSKTITPDVSKSKATVAPTATKVPTAPTAATVPAAPTATAVPTASTATKKTNPLASLFQKLFGKK